MSTDITHIVADPEELSPRCWNCRFASDVGDDHYQCMVRSERVCVVWKNFTCDLHERREEE